MLHKHLVTYRIWSITRPEFIWNIRQFFFIVIKLSFQMKIYVLYEKSVTKTNLTTKNLPSKKLLVSENGQLAPTGSCSICSSLPFKIHNALVFIARYFFWIIMKRDDYTRLFKIANILMPKFNWKIFVICLLFKNYENVMSIFLLFSI